MSFYDKIYKIIIIYNRNMPTISRKFLVRVFVLSVFLILSFNIWENLINANTSLKTTTTTENKTIFKKENNSILGISWVAITTNIGTRLQQKRNIPVTIYKEIMSLEEMLNNTKQVGDELIWKNMIIINEYKNVLKTDVKKLLWNSYNKSALLDAYIEQLEFRYVNGVKNEQQLINQNNVLETAMNDANSQIEVLKGKIGTDFSSNDSEASVQNIEKYLEIKREYDYARIYAVYINQFIVQYDFLNNYNKNLLDVLINNKEALIKDVFVVIPDNWGIDSLKSFNLIYDEATIKK